MNNGAKVQLLGRYERKSLAEIKSHLVAKNAERPRAGAITFCRAVLTDMAHEVEVLPHIRL
jgi:hypothetical protein